MSLDSDLQPFDWQSIEAAFVEWVESASGLDALWEDQNLPQLPYPFVTLKRTNIASTGTGDELRTSTDLSQAGEEVELLTTNQSEFTLNVQVLTDEDHGANDPMANSVFFAGRLKASLHQHSRVEAFRAVGLALIEDLNIQDVSGVENGQFINRASLDVRFRVASQMTERIGYIDKVEVESTELGVGPFIIDASEG